MHEYIPVRRTAAYISILLIDQVQIRYVVKPLTHGAQQEIMQEETLYSKNRKLEAFRKSNLRPYILNECKLSSNHPMLSPHAAPNKNKELLLDCTDYTSTIIVHIYIVTLEKKGNITKTKASS